MYFEDYSIDQVRTSRGRTITEAFRFITDVTMPVVITTYGSLAQQAKVRARVARIRAAVKADKPLPVGDLRYLQRFTVNLPARTREKPDVDAQCRPIIPELLSEWAGTYDMHTGIDVTPKDQEYIL